MVDDELIVCVPVSVFGEISVGENMGSTRSTDSGIPSFTAPCGSHGCNNDSLVISLPKLMLFSASWS